MSGETKRKTRILLADDQHVVRQGIRRILEGEPDLDVVGEADDGEEAVRLARELKPDVVLMEARMTRLDGVEVARRIKEEQPKTAVLIFTTCDEEEYIVGLVGAGADGYLLKSTKSEELAQAIRFVRGGEFVSDPLVVRKLFKRVTRQTVAVNTAEHLTRRELEVLKLAAKGMSNHDIAGQLGVGLRTVKGHITSLLSKTGTASRTEAVLIALKQGWVRLDDD